MTSTPALPIALDAMGGDLAPQVTVQGAVDAARRFSIGAILVGNEQAICQELAKYGAPSPLITVVHASDAIGMKEHAATAVRRRRDSSMHVACRLVKEGKAAAAVSAGNSGAFFAIAMFTLGRLDGVERPALATIFPTMGSPALLLDVGANAEVRASHLAQFAVMGSAYARSVLGRAHPTVALLSIGEEAEKGPPAVQEAHQILKQTALNFVGNVEGRDVPRGAADVVVSDGYAGNVLIKASEGVAETLLSIVRSELTSSWWTKLLAAGLRPAFRRVRRRLDYAEYGGAPLLGLDGVAIIAHGRSNALAISNAIRVAHDAATTGLTSSIREGLALNREEPSAGS